MYFNQTFHQRTSGTSVFYSFATDYNSNVIPINSSITDGYATIRWNDKDSGASIEANYSFTPFIQNIENPVVTTGTNGKTWITTNYELGKTIVGSDLKRSDLNNYNITNDCILFNQGIYIIQIKDEAGNECLYSFVIDRTENFFNIQSEVVSNKSLIYGSNVNYSVGDYKAFELDLEDAEINPILKEYIEKASLNNLKDFQEGLYYTGSYSNINLITKYFQKSNNKYYFTVKNNGVVAYDMQDVQDKTVSGLRGELIYRVAGETYFKRSLYAVAENQTFLNMINSTHPDYKSLVQQGSFVTVEINKDNARGMVYYSDSEILDNSIPADGDENGTVKRLDTGSDTVDASGEISGLLKAEATSSKYVAFVWNLGIGNFEVGQVYYTYYTLKPNAFNESNNGKYFFYEEVDRYDIYNEGWIDKDYSIGEGRAKISFNGSEETREGLYVVTRVYKDEGGDFGEDEKVKNYYFIVDRNEIINIPKGIGGSIKIALLENEVEFNEFSIKNADTGILSVDNNINNERYSIYLKTTKVPAVINVPIGKYFDGEHVSTYNAGSLKVEVFFNDSYGQLPGAYKNRSLRIYDSTYNKVVENDVFKIDIAQYLEKINLEVKERLVVSEGNVDWLWLSGDYVVRISDNVEDTSKNNHVKYIGFRIVGKDDVGPTVEIGSGIAKDSLVEIDVTKQEQFTYTATVSQEFLNVTLPAYKEDVYAKAQIDPNYLVVKQYYGENAIPLYYINHAYEPKNGINLKEDSKIVSLNVDGGGNLLSISVWLDTKLRDAEGEIDLVNLNKPLKYEIVVRYKIGNDAEYERYKNCYAYYDSVGNKVYYFEAKYTITIDREAPKANIEKLNEIDTFVEEYNKMFGSTSMIGNGVHKTSSNLYFTKQYSKYYENNKEIKGLIYAYQVESNMVFDKTDVQLVYTKPISNLASYNLTLPLIDVTGYNVRNVNSFETYEGLGLTSNRYYEIIEKDHAGNLTQYVIHYEPAEVEFNIPFSVTTTLGEVDKIVEFDFDDNESINIFKLDSVNDTSIENVKFMKVEIVRVGGAKILELLTVSTFDFNKLNEYIASAINLEESGNFIVNIYSRQSTVKTFQINLYDSNNVKSLNIEDLIYKNGTDYSVRLHNANKLDENNVLFFATRITVKASTDADLTVYVADFDGSGNLQYKKHGVDGVFAEHVCDANTTYYITMTDVLGNFSKYRFNTNGLDFYDVLFKNPQLDDTVVDEYGEFYYESGDGTNITYYGYTSAMVKFDKMFLEKVYVKNAGKYFEAELGIDYTFENRAGNYNYIFISPDYNNEVLFIEARVDLYADENADLVADNDEFEISYYIVIDARLGTVALRDYNSGEQRNSIIKTFNNKKYDDESILADKSGSGIMNLQWSEIETNNYFFYAYNLYELKKDGEYIVTNLNNVNNYVISTSEDSKGVYKLEILVYGRNLQLLGNRIFAFEVQKVSTQVYYVRNAQGEAIKENSEFKVEEVVAFITEIESWLTDKGKAINPNVSYPLYITNQNLTVVSTSSTVNKDSIVINRAGYSFELVLITKPNAYDIYLGILKVFEDESLVQNVKIVCDGDETSVTNKTSLTVAGDVDDEILINANVDFVLDVLLRKNYLQIEIYYNNQYVKTEDFSGNYSIAGNGQYKFVIKDLAGNVHVYENGLSDLEVYVLRKVVVLVNDEVPVDYGFYNDAVTLNVFASTKYVTGSIMVDAKKNGQEYIPEGYNPYVFSDYGTYRVVITASYAGLADPLETVVTFTIINVKEARKSIDLTSLNGSKITSITNPKGVDVTQEFL
ncbi:MAG: hypothetical protein IKY10_04520, partial [Clostridia bacterium]|nr:hypothetical protein [Clostridia bacterium]